MAARNDITGDSIKSRHNSKSFSDNFDRIFGKKEGENMEKEKQEFSGIEQRTPEWFAARKNKLTGSIAGAALGLDPYRTKDDILRLMVREALGAEREFQGNIATDYGANSEPLALLDFELETGAEVEQCGFFVSPTEQWLGASPDGLIGDEAILEIKCPFSLRDKEKPVFKSIYEQPHYYIQLQVEMFCTERKKAYFYQWAQNGTNLEIVDFDEDFLTQELPLLRDFYQLFEEELEHNKQKHLEPLIQVLDDADLFLMVDKYHANKEQINMLEAENKDILKWLIDMSGGKNSQIGDSKLTKVERAGSVNYKKIPELQGVDLEQYRGKPVEYWRLS